MDHLKALLAISVLMLSAVSWADCAVQAELIRTEGQVSVKPAGKVARVTPKKLPYSLCSGDEVHTFTGRAMLRSNAKDAMVLDANSQLLVKERGSAGVMKGDVLFSVQKRGESNQVNIATRLTVIGVKGTRFLVSDHPGRLSVAMDEGVVEVISTKGDLKLFREKSAAEQAEFSDFKKEGEQAVEAQKKEFESYKENLQREFIGYVKNVVLEAGNALDLTPGQAISRQIGKANRDAMNDLKAWSLR